MSQNDEPRWHDNIHMNTTANVTNDEPRWHDNMNTTAYVTNDEPHRPNIDMNTTEKVTK